MKRAWRGVGDVVSYGEGSVGRGGNLQIVVFGRLLQTASGANGGAEMPAPLVFLSAGIFRW